MAVKDDAQYPVLTALINEVQDLKEIYQGALDGSIETTNAVELLNARDGKATLKEKIDEIDANITALDSSIDSINSSLGTKVNKGDLILNVKDYGAVGDGVSDDTAAISTALENGKPIYFPDGTYIVNGFITKSNKNVKIYGKNVIFKGTGGFTFNSDLSASVAASDIVDGDNKITSSLACAVGDYIQISGSISHSLYTPSRYASVKFIAKVIDVSGGVIKIDRQISYNLTSVTACKILNPYSLSVKGITLYGVYLNIVNCIVADIEITAKGSVSNPIAISQSCDFNIDYKGIDLNNTVQGIVLNDCNNFKLNMIGNNIGMQDGTGTRAIRGNGLQNGEINAILNSSYVGDSMIYGSRSLNFKIVSIGAGRYFRDNAITTTNRVEAVQFSECDNIILDANMDKVDDQALEFLSVYKGIIKAKVNTLPNSTEGAIVVKGGSQDITIINPVIRCNNPFGIKIECSNNVSDNSVSTRTNDVKIINPDIVNLAANSYGIIVRDSPIAVNAYVKILGGYIKAYFPVAGADINHNYITIKDCIIETTGGHAIQSIGDYLTVDNVTVLGGNVITVRAVVSSGTNDKVSRVTSDGAIYLRTNARDNFKLNNFLDNRVPYLWFDTKSWHIYADKQQYRVTAAPTEYTWERDVRFGLVNATASGYAEIVCVTAGTPGTWKNCNLITA